MISTTNASKIECTPCLLSGGGAALMLLAQGAGVFVDTFSFAQQFPQQAQNVRLFVPISAGAALLIGSCVSQQLMNSAKVTAKTAQMIGFCSGYIAGLGWGSLAVEISRAYNGPY